MEKEFEIGSLVQIKRANPFFEDKLGVVVEHQTGDGWSGLWLKIQWSDGIQSLERSYAIVKVG